MAKNSFNYSEAIAEVERILEKFRTEQLDVDQLTTDVKRATTLIAACRERLTKVEEEVTKILEA
ncbi:MAG: exodeoxyribonuclease VII small subunit [Alistipes sp.]|nr:exodeoxyribonuclease VII small subunit [Alistipes sp.]